MRKRAWLIVKSDGTVRVHVKNPSGRLAVDEIAVPIDIAIPDAWGRVRAQGLSIEMPEPPDIVDMSKAADSDDRGAP